MTVINVDLVSNSPVISVEVGVGYGSGMIPVASKETLGGIKVGENLKINNGVLSVDTTNTATEDNTKPITSAAVYAEIGNIGVLLEAI